MTTCPFPVIRGRDAQGEPIHAPCGCFVSARSITGRCRTHARQKDAQPPRLCSSCDSPIGQSSTSGLCVKCAALKSAHMPNAEMVEKSGWRKWCLTPRQFEPYR